MFYKSQWEVVGELFCNIIKGIFEDPIIIKEHNETFIALIPKVVCVENMNQFRPISLCNVSYKIVTNILSIRLRKVMEELVDHVSAFLFSIEIVRIILLLLKK